MNNNDNNFSLDYYVKDINPKNRAVYINNLLTKLADRNHN